MKKIRQNVFETNSSSTHSICIAKECTLSIPEALHFAFGEFGWECDTLYSLHEKANYLYTGLFSNDRMEDFEKLCNILKSKGINITFEKPIYKEGQSWAENSGYVDHANELRDFLNAICEDQGKMMRFLFSDMSFIITGNDNDDEDVAINVGYEYDEYYKGN